MTKTALVTGGARGIGRACALALADSGLDIALVDLLEEEMAATARDIEARGRRTLTFQADVSDFARAHAIVEQINTKWGHLDVLLNNAGAPNPKPILEITEAEFDRTIAINLKSCFNFIHAAAPIGRRQHRALSGRRGAYVHDRPAFCGRWISMELLSRAAPPDG
jgi:3-oxoacyl-[acyl-carrier protein] reductase